MSYKQALTDAMTWLGTKQDTFFLGQAVEYPGTAMYNTLEEVDKNKRLELPVFENTQMGISIGMSLNGFCPISIFPRFNFLLCAIDQIVNHLDKYYDIGGGYIKNIRPKVIIRTSIGSDTPMFPGHQHIGDFTSGLKSMCKNINVVRLDKEEEIWQEYRKAYYTYHSTILVEHGNLLN